VRRLLLRLRPVVAVVLVASGATVAATMGQSGAQTLPGGGSSSITLPFPTTTVTLPPTTLPQTTVPKVTIPKVTVPKVTVPKVTVPKVTVPKVTVPKVTVPGATVPKVTVPKSNKSPASPNIAPGSSASSGSSSAPPMNCPPEQYPAANAPANAASTPYEIPVTAKINGGYFQVTGTNNVTLTLGPPEPAQGYPNGTLFGNLCGLLQLPSQTGSISGNPLGFPGDPYDNNYNNNLYFYGPGGGPIPTCIGPAGMSGVCVLSGYASAEGNVIAQVEKTPAANGGLNIDLYGSAKSTATFSASQLVPVLPPGTGPTTGGSTCTVAIGNLLTDGLSSLSSEGAPPAGTSYTAPVHFTTGASGAITGQPVTGPITAGQSEAVSNDFVVAPIDPNMPPVPEAPGATSSSPSQECSPSVASLLNQIIGLPSPPGKNTFKAPTDFAINVCNEPGLPKCQAQPKTFG
jgi:hypothetical protein